MEDYIDFSTAFNKILLSKSNVFPELIAGFFHSEWSTQELVPLLGQGGHEKITAAKGQLTVGLEPTETGGAMGVFQPQPSHKSSTQPRSVGWRKMSHWASSRTHQAGYCAGGSGISAHGDLPHGLNVTSRVGALLSSQPF